MGQEKCNCKTCKKISKIYAVVEKLNAEDRKVIEDLVMENVINEEENSLWNTLYPPVSCVFLIELQRIDKLEEFQSDISELIEKYNKDFKLN